MGSPIGVGFDFGKRNPSLKRQNGSLNKMLNFSPLSTRSISGNILTGFLICCAEIFCTQVYEVDISASLAVSAVATPPPGSTFGQVFAGSLEQYLIAQTDGVFFGGTQVP